MLNNLIQGDVVKKISRVYFRIEEPGVDPVSIFSGDPLSIPIRLDAVGIASPVSVVSKTFSKPAADIQHPYVLRDPAIGRAAITPQPRFQPPWTFMRLMGLFIERAPRIIFRV